MVDVPVQHGDTPWPVLSLPVEGKVAFFLKNSALLKKKGPVNITEPFVAKWWS
jgi:hypothetical protein